MAQQAIAIVEGFCYNARGVLDRGNVGEQRTQV